MKNSPGKLTSVLIWLRLVDPHDGLLSLTSISLIIALVKFALVREVTLTELTAFLAMAGFYSFKRSRTPKAIAAPTLDLSKAHSDMTSARDAMKATEDKMRLMMETVSLGRR